MSISQNDILEAVGNMSVMEVVELIKAFEEKFGVTAAAASAGPAAAAAVVEEQTEFNVMLTEAGEKKVNVIKAAAFEGKFLAANQIDVLATLPTRDEAISQLMSVIQGATSKLARTLAAIRDQKEAAAA